MEDRINREEVKPSLNVSNIKLNGVEEGKQNGECFVKKKIINYKSFHQKLVNMTKMSNRYQDDYPTTVQEEEIFSPFSNNKLATTPSFHTNANTTKRQYLSPKKRTMLETVQHKLKKSAVKRRMMTQESEPFHRRGNKLAQGNILSPLYMSPSGLHTPNQLSTSNLKLTFE